MVPQLLAGPIFQVEAVEEGDDDHDDGEDQTPLLAGRVMV